MPPAGVEILRRIGRWYAAVKESLEEVEPASTLTSNRSVLLTRRGNTLYVHIVDPVSSAVKLVPIDAAPQRATLLNTGKPVDFAVEMVPSEHVAHKPCLRLRRLPANEMAGTVMVVKLEFEDGRLS